MMKNKKLIYGVIVTFVLVVFTIFIWTNYQFLLPPQISGQCGIENCHGLDITCGQNIPEACDMMYMAGDNCRHFANCQIFDGQCKLSKSPRFDSCKACVEKCVLDFSDDQINFLKCESGCAK